MEMTMKMGAFETLDHQEMMEIDGGTWQQAGYGFLGALSIAGAPIAGCFSPAVGVALLGTGLYLMGSATK